MKFEKGFGCQSMQRVGEDKIGDTDGRHGKRDI